MGSLIRNDYRVYNLIYELRFSLFTKRGKFQDLINQIKNYMLAVFTPIGGLAFVAGWICLAVGVLKRT
ncbi:MAG: hypothetical protein Q8R96_15285 [Bacteroidota bacterium]|nr:hypothetical protein [Bacteroidota bacterium]